MSEQSINNGGARVPLRRWIEGEAKRQISAERAQGVDEKKCGRETILRKTTIAYGIAELLRHVRSHAASDSPPLPPPDELCRIDNFVVQVCGEAPGTATWNDVDGLDMISPKRTVCIAEPSFLFGGFSDDNDGDADHDNMGRYMEAEFPSHSEDETDVGVSTAAAGRSEEEDGICHDLGALLYELFCHITFPNGNDQPEEPAHKKARLAGQKEAPTPYVPLVDLGFPSSICMVIQNLIDCTAASRPDDAYESLDAVIKDLHLLLLDPDRFLFDQDMASNAQLLFRENKLYGREDEVSSITDAFCRVSSGKSEAFFIGGFSGSGKSMLVNSLKARVDMSGGYVLTRKFDQMCKERPLLEVISVFNSLCLLVCEKSYREDLLEIVKNLTDVFGDDFSVLARLLPNIGAISPQLKQSDSEKHDGDRMNLQSVCFTLQRFMRVISSESHPVMLFLDDLQWCDSSALALIEGILSDKTGSSCLFFVGCYRSNEVEDDHEVFRLMSRLKSISVPTTTLSLEGLNPDDLNTMISDALCMFPRICQPLSDIVFQKTKGNPFFVLAFLRSLVDEGLLEYDTKKRRWIWAEDRISSMGITDNVLQLLSSKMSGLSGIVQFTLKVAACFGTKVNESVVGYLSACAEYASIRDGLDQAVREGFMVKATNSGVTEFKFCHDKVREAAYSLIPESERKQYHCSIGMSLYTVTRGKDVQDIVFCIADQINYGVDDSLSQLRFNLAGLNETAGAKAADSSDYVSAHSYFKNALSFLPPDHWKDNYEMSLRLYLRLAKSAFSCGDKERAYEILQQILTEARCLTDKLDAYHLAVLILHDKEALEDAYMTIFEVLRLLGESIPDAFGEEEAREMVKTTSKMVASVSEESLHGMKRMEGKVQQDLLKFYNAITVISFSAKPWMVPFFTCRVVQLSMNNGICEHSLIAMRCSNTCLSNAQEAHKIAKIAMSARKRFDASTDQIPRIFYLYYGMIAVYVDPVQSCIENLRRGLECGLAVGETSPAFICAINIIRLSLIAGTDLPTLLKRAEYYIDVTNSHSNSFAKTNLLLYRDTIMMLMGSNGAVPEIKEDELNIPPDTILYHKAIRAYWVGHSERCHHFAEKLIQGSMGGRHHRLFFSLYYGINCLKIIRRTSTQKLKAVPRDTLAVLKEAASHSRWNFRNKVHLLEAEIFSYEGRAEEAKASYAAAIASARSSNFIHEQGLACELAGHHYKKIDDHRSARAFFNQAKQCYSEWGSQVRVDCVSRQLEGFKISLA